MLTNRIDESRKFTSDELNTAFYLENSELIENWFVSDAEYTEVFDFLDEYKIPTLVLNNRHPLYMDFNYRINILKFNTTVSKPDTRKNVFSTINEYFNGSDVDVAVESFDFEYFNSNVNKRIDLELTDSTGFVIDLETSIMLTSENVKEEYLNIPLSFPFENLFDNNGDIVEDNLPKLHLNLNDTGDLESNLLTITQESVTTSLITYNMKYNNTNCGKMYIFNGFKKYILVKIDFSLSSIVRSKFDTPRYMKINYPSPNFSVMQNVIPRLNSVTFD